MSIDSETMRLQAAVDLAKREAKATRLRELVADGLSVPEIAERMGLTPHAVRNSLKSLGLRAAPVNDGLSKMRGGPTPGPTVWTRTVQVRARRERR